MTKLRVLLENLGVTSYWFPLFFIVTRLSWHNDKKEKFLKDCLRLDWEP